MSKSKPIVKSKIKTGKSKPALTKAPSQQELQDWEASKEKTKKIAKQQGIHLTSWQIVYKTIERWAADDAAAAQERAIKIAENHPLIKEELANAARAVQEGTHEQVNASSQAMFILYVSLGLPIPDGKTFERTAQLKDGSRAPITKIAEKQRLPTTEFLTKPVPAKEIKNVSGRVAKKDKDKHLLTGHTGAAYFTSKLDKSNQVVSHQGSSTGKDGIHVAQLNAQKQYTHHKSFSMGLSKEMDKRQENGDGIIEAHEHGGFHEKSNWQGYSIEDDMDALVVSSEARFTSNKRQTKEKHLRAEYDTPDNLSETYSEIDTASETESTHHDEFINRTLTNPKYSQHHFAKKNNIDPNSPTLKGKFKDLRDRLDNARGR